MSLTSMTGFARAAATDEGLGFTWEIKSVNGKALDLRLRLPPGLDHLDVPARQALSAAVKRGNLQINLSQSEGASASKFTLNRAVLQQYVALAQELNQQIGGPAPSAEALLGMKGVVELSTPAADEASQAARDKAIMAALQEAITALSEARKAEGAKLTAILKDQLDQVAALHRRASDNPARKPEAIKARLRQQVSALLEAGLPDEQRLAQEAALLFTKSDIQEELDRLALHISAARSLLNAKEPVGRKFDFLAQEFNREANTLCSKANDSGLTAIGLDLKTVIDQMREQVQNIE